MKITNKIHQLKIPFTIPLPDGKSLERFVNCFIITSQKIYLIDTGVKGCENQIFEYIKNLGYNENDINAVLLTHAHPDHIGALQRIHELTHCKIYIHESEKLWVEDINEQFKVRPVPGFYNLVGGNANITNTVFDNQRINLESGITLKVIETPGHSDGSVSYYFEEEKTLISGDAIILPGELPIYTDCKKYLDSIEKLKLLLPTTLLSSWDTPKFNDGISVVLQNSVAYINKINEIVKDVSRQEGLNDPLQFCKSVLKKLGIPEFVANPLLVKSFISHLGV